MSIYLFFVLTIALVALVFGVAGPALVSAESTEGVLLGVVLVAATLPVLFLLIKKILKAVKDAQFKRSVKDEKNG